MLICAIERLLNLMCCGQSLKNSLYSIVVGILDSPLRRQSNYSWFDGTNTPQEGSRRRGDISQGLETLFSDILPEEDSLQV